MTRVDLLVVGAGPAGMAAATTARRLGADVLVIDEQPSPGGQIWRSIETTRSRDAILGAAYVEGRRVAEAFRQGGAAYWPNAKLWRLEPGVRAYLSIDGEARLVEAACVILATGAQERPAPFPGWTLPGVLTVGAAQILLKSSGQIPDGPVWIAGSGPLPLLYAYQLLQAGGVIAGYLDTTPPGQWRSALRHLPGALMGARELAKGLAWTAAVRRGVGRFEAGVTLIEAIGDGRVEALRYKRAGKSPVSVAARTVLVHEGVVPSIHPALSVDCDVAWSHAQDCFAPITDDWGQSSLPGLFIAGDGAGIGGAKAAVLRGELAALKAARLLGRLEESEMEPAAGPLRRKLARELAPRAFLDALFRPRREVFEPADQTIVCRCEEITAGQVRARARVGQPGPNQVKAATRGGMGPCQGRQCGYSITRILAAAQDRTPADVGYLNIRPPLKPLTLGELASLDMAAGARRESPEGE